VVKYRVRRISLAAALLVASACTSLPRPAPMADGRVTPDDGAIRHLLNRVTFGARAGDVDRVRQIGVARFLDEQLHPQLISDTALDARLRDLHGLTISPRAFATDYYQPMANARQEFTATQKVSVTRLPYLRWHLQPIAAVSLPGDKRVTVLQQAPVTPEELRFQRENQAVFDDLQAQKLLRAVYSERQLQEVLTDFWFNHFNVDARKIEDRPVVAEYERETIRPRVFGRFRDLLEATATSPAMLFYLDNWMSTAPQPRTGRGLNENYGRELLELHTLGVDGGYTQHDVVEVARCFTGWTMANPHDGLGFVFKPQVHDRGEKRVLGHKIRAGGGVEDGEAVLDIVSRHPSTARFIATKLVRRFVADDPPPALVARAARTFRRTDGDLRDVMRTILTSPEFYSAAARSGKTKSPFEYVVSVLRATDADVTSPRAVLGVVANMGEPLYQSQPPTGYPDRARDWINTGALVSRMNFAYAAASGGVGGVAIDRARADVAVRTLMARGAIDDTPVVMRLAELLGGPAFQQR
jgi:uncharacterized protein (DUF1800 family)